uniref:Photosystem II reaction center X protein n=1 Tax=Araucaria cunninghamii TaxID=56994 RepID=A0A0D6R8Q2_ARACU
MASATAVSLASPIATLVNNSGTSKRASQLQTLSVCSPYKKVVGQKSRVVMMSNAVPKKQEQSQSQSLAAVTTLGVLAATLIPEMAEAAAPGVSPSLKNFLLSIVSGGVVLAVIGVAVIGVSNFDPVKRT